MKMIADLHIQSRSFPDSFMALCHRVVLINTFIFAIGVSCFIFLPLYAQNRCKPLTTSDDLLKTVDGSRLPKKPKVVELVKGDKPNRPIHPEYTIAKFLDELNVRVTPTPKKIQVKDLSSRFKPIQYQGDSHVCFTAALVADMESFEKVPMLSIRHAHIVAALGDGPELPGEEIFKNSFETAEVLNRLSKIGAIIEENDRADTISTESVEMEELGRILTETNYRLAHAAIANVDKGEATFDLLRSLIDAKKPPIVIFRDEAGLNSHYEVQNGWMKYSTEKQGHAVNFVGYGEGLNPFTNKVERYFLVRDSAAPKKMYLKLAADPALLNQIRGLVKVVQVEKVSGDGQTLSRYP